MEKGDALSGGRQQELAGNAGRDNGKTAESEGRSQSRAESGSRGEEQAEQPGTGLSGTSLRGEWVKRTP